MKPLNLDAVAVAVAIAVAVPVAVSVAVVVALALAHALAAPVAVAPVVTVVVADTAVAAISFEAKFKSTGPHRRSLTNPRVRTGSPLQIHESAQAVSYDLEVQIATEIMRLSLPLSLSPLLMLLLLVSGWYHIRTRLVPDSY